MFSTFDFSARLLKTVLQKVYIYSFILQYCIPVTEPVNHHGDAIDGAGGGHDGSCMSQHKFQKNKSLIKNMSTPFLF